MKGPQKLAFTGLLKSGSHRQDNIAIITKVLQGHGSGDVLTLAEVGIKAANVKTSPAFPTTIISFFFSLLLRDFFRLKLPIKVLPWFSIPVVISDFLSLTFAH